jgi:predicted PurR-regulated permease PerM
MPEHRAPVDRRPSPILPAHTPGTTSVLTIATTGIVIAGLYFGRSVLIPITLAVLLAFLLAPLVEFLHRIRLPDFLAALLAVVLALGVVLAFGGLIGTQVADLSGQVPRYASTIETKIETVQQFALSRFDAIMRGIGRQFVPRLTHEPATGGTSQQTPGNSQPPPIPVEVHQPSSSAMQVAEQIVEPLINPLAALAIVFVVSTFILAQREDLRDRIIRLFGAADLHRTTIAMDETARRLSRYFLAQLAINVSFGLFIGIALFFIGLPSPVLWGVIAMLLRFLPYIGAPLAALLPLLLAAATSPGWASVLWTAAVFGVGEAVMGQVVEPLVYGRSTGLSPVAVVVAAIVWTWLWGPIGLILSTPLTLCFMILGRHFEQLEFLDILLGDRPALRPDESFYQRMLANDPDEAREQAEQFLKEASLARYYDEVAVPGLRRAAMDAGRGALDTAAVARVLESAYALIEDLAEEAKPDAASAEAWQANHGIVLCVAGRGPMDEAAARMLAQLLGERGIAAHAVPYRAVSRSEQATLQARCAAFAGCCRTCRCWSGYGRTERRRCRTSGCASRSGRIIMPRHCRKPWKLVRASCGNRDTRPMRNRSETIGCIISTISSNMSPDATRQDHIATEKCAHGARRPGVPAAARGHACRGTEGCHLEPELADRTPRWRCVAAGGCACTRAGGFRPVTAICRAARCRRGRHPGSGRPCRRRPPFPARALFHPHDARQRGSANRHRCASWPDLRR